MSNKLVGQRIWELRVLHNYTRETLAEMVDISAKFLYEIETGKKGFSAETLSRLSKALSVSCDYIMFGEEKERRGMENVMCALETVGPKQRSRMQDILRILYDMCEKIEVQ